MTTPDYRAALERLIELNEDCAKDVWTRAIAAALRTAANQVVPEGPKPSANSDYHLMNWTKSLDQYYQRQATRDQLLTIATELEGQ